MAESTQNIADSRMRLLLAGIVLACSFAVGTTFVSNNLHPRFEHRAETIEQQFAILQGRPYLLDGVRTYFPEFQNRILFPLLFAVTAQSRIGSISQEYLVLRLLTATLAFLVFWHLLTAVGGVSLRVAAVGMGMLAYVLIFTFNHGWEHPTDYLDVIMASLFVWVCLAHRRLAAVGLALLAAANRESAPFIGVIWFALYGMGPDRKPQYKEIAFAAGLVVLAYGMVLSIRYALGGTAALAPQTTAIVWLGDFIGEFIARPSPSGWPVLLVAMVAPLALWLWVDREWMGPTEKRLLLAGVAIALIAPLFGIVKELRFFIPAAVPLIYTACCAERNRSARMGEIPEVAT